MQQSANVLFLRICKDMYRGRHFPEGVACHDVSRMRAKKPESHLQTMTLTPAGK
jgi:hypothetical protein